MMVDMRLACVLASLVLAACAKDPREPVESRPATAALTQEMVAQPPPVAVPDQPREAGAAAPPAIVVAQIGWKLDAKGLLADPATEIPAASAIYGMAIFRGVQDQQGQVELQVYDAGERQLSTQKARFTLKGDTAVVLNVKPSGRQWPPGNYRALYLCDGRPCWEIRFALQ